MGPKPPKVQPPPPPPLPPAPPVPEKEPAGGDAAALEELIRRQRGRASTLLTGGLGAPGQATVQKPTLLGS